MKISDFFLKNSKMRVCLNSEYYLSKFCLNNTQNLSNLRITRINTDFVKNDYRVPHLQGVAHINH